MLSPEMQDFFIFIIDIIVLHYVFKRIRKMNMLSYLLFGMSLFVVVQHFQIKNSYISATFLFILLDCFALLFGYLLLIIKRELDITQKYQVIALLMQETWIVSLPLFAKAHSGLKHYQQQREKFKQTLANLRNDGE